MDGKVVILPSETVRRIRFTESWAVLALSLPAVLLRRHGVRVPEAIVTHGYSMPSRGLRGLVQSLLEGTEETRQLAGGEAAAEIEHGLEGVLLDLAGLVIADRLDSETEWGTPHALLRDHAQDFIERHRSEVDLDPEAVARRMNVSLRQLQSIFAEVGLTVSGEIRRARAQLARGMLIDGHFDALSVEGVAARSGFGAAMSMRRALAEFYGCSPSELRHLRGKAPVAVEGGLPVDWVPAAPGHLSANRLRGMQFDRVSAQASVPRDHDDFLTSFDI